MKFYFSELLSLLGLSAVSYGLWLVHPSCAFIGTGAALVAFGLLTHKSLPKKESK